MPAVPRQQGLRGRGSWKARRGHYLGQGIRSGLNILQNVLKKGRQMGTILVIKDFLSI